MDGGKEFKKEISDGKSSIEWLVTERGGEGGGRGGRRNGGGIGRSECRIRVNGLEPMIPTK